MVLPHLVLIWLHRELSGQMRVPGFHHSDLRPFMLWHRIYLVTNTAQWFAGMVFMVLTLRQWRREDGVAENPLPTEIKQDSTLTQ
jgi:hypothetical protein